MLTKAELITDIQAEIGESSAESVDLTGHLTSAESCETHEDLLQNLLEAKQAAEAILSNINDQLSRLECPLNSKAIETTIPEGFYRCVVRRNGRSYWAGPFPTESHAWDNSYANDELDSKKSNRSTRYAMLKSGVFMSIMHSRFLMEDVNSARSEGQPVTHRLVDIPTPVYANLLGKDGLLTY